MKKTLTIILALCGICSIFQLAYAQGSYKNNSATPYFFVNNEGANNEPKPQAIWSNDFSNASHWNILNEAGNNYNWVIGTVGPTGPFAIPKITSPTANNGFALFDSDLYCNGKQYTSIINANPFSLVGHPNVELQFYQQYKKFYDSTFVFVSNNGIDWKKYNLNLQVPFNGSTSSTAELVKINISEVAGNRTNVWIKFTYYSDTLTMGNQAGCNYAWMVDDVSVVDLPNNGLVLKEIYHSEYSRIPKGLQTPIQFSGYIANESPIKRTNVRLNVKVNNNLYDNESLALDTLNVNAKQLFTLPTLFNPTGIGNFTLSFEALHNEIDPNPSDNYKTSYFAVTDSVYARDSYYYSGAGYTGAANSSFEIGNIFYISSAKIASSVDVVLHSNTQAGAKIRAKIYQKTPTGFSLVASSNNDTIFSSEIPTGYGLNPVSKNIKFTGNPVVLQSGKYYLVTIAYDFDPLYNNKKVTIASGSTIEQPANSSYFLDVLTSTWYAVNYTPMIRLNMVFCNLNISLSSVMDTCLSGKGRATVTPLSGTPPYAYTWSSSLAQHNDSSTTTNLVAGIYSVVVADARGCTGTGTIEVLNKPVQLSIATSSTSAFCNNPVGEASVIGVTGGRQPYTYLWNTAANQNNTAATTTNLLPGIYAVTVTDATGCKADTSVLVSNQNIALRFNVDSIESTCGHANGKAFVSAFHNGMQPYTYKWSTLPVQHADTAKFLMAGKYYVTVNDKNGCYGVDSIVVTNNTAGINTTTGSSSTTICGMSDGKAWVNHASPDPYTYKWLVNPVQTNDTLLNIPAGMYKVVVTETLTGCFDTLVASVSDGLTPNFTIDNVINVNCYGTATGAISTTFAAIPTSDYLFINTSHNPIDTIFSASGDVTNIPSGTYVVVAHAGACIATRIVEVLEPEPIILSYTKQDVLCSAGNDGSIDLSVNGGYGNYTYQWIKLGPPNINVANTQDLNNIAAGTYVVEIRDDQMCVKKDTIVVNEPLPMQVQFNKTDILCYGSSTGRISIASLQNGTPPFTYLWSNSETTSSLNNIQEGKYKVTITDSRGCSIVDSVTLIQPSEITISAISVDSAHAGVAEGSLTVTVSGGVGSFMTYLWSTGATTATINNLYADSTYTVTVTDANNCKKVKSFIIPKTYIGFEEYKIEDANVLIYPNPADDYIIINVKAERRTRFDVSIYGVYGNVIFTRQSDGLDDIFFAQIPLQHVAKGIYFINIRTSSGNIVRKFIKR